MAKSRPLKIPLKMYDYLKVKATHNESTMKYEAGRMFEDYIGLKKKLDGKKVLVFR